MRPETACASRVGADAKPLLDACKSQDDASFSDGIKTLMSSR